MRSQFASSAVGVFLAAGLTAAPVAAQHEHHGGSGEQLGTVSFETSCDPGVRDAFNRGVALLHSFEFRFAADAFTQVLEQDADCAMAHWGIALSHWGNPFAGLKSGPPLERGGASVARARATGSPTARERAYIDAVAELFEDHETVPQRTRTVAYEQAMERLHQSFPEDTEAAIFYALSVNQNADPADKTYAQQLKAAAILEPLFAGQPDHPGLAHYIIHAYDHPPLAEKALAAARRYAEIAPSASHALHMPSHTFTRVGYWDESIATNIASAEAAMKADDLAGALHAMDYQTYAYLQLAQDGKARKVLDRVAPIATRLSSAGVAGAAPPMAGLFAMAAMPARFALERGAWQEAAALTPLSEGPPFTIAITHFARALGAARSGQPAAARADIDRLAELRDKLEAMNDTYWTEQVDIQRRVAAAWAAFAEGGRDEAIAALRAAADAEDATDKSAVTPGPLAPARELLGEMLLEAERHADARAAFEAAMKKEPNRFRGLYGAARAAELSGDTETAKQYYSQLVELARSADTERPELAHARAFLAGRSTSGAARRP